MIPGVVLYHVNGSRLNGTWCVVFLATSAKLYCHSFLRTLNARDRLRDRLRKNTFSQFHAEAFQNYNHEEITKEPVNVTASMAAKTHATHLSFSSEAGTQYSESVRMFKRWLGFIVPASKIISVLEFAVLCWTSRWWFRIGKPYSKPHSSQLEPPFWIGYYNQAKSSPSRRSLRISSLSHIPPYSHSHDVSRILEEGPNDPDVVPIPPIIDPKQIERTV